MRRATWQILFGGAMLALCLAGCETTESGSDTKSDASLTADGGNLPDSGALPDSAGSDTSTPPPATVAINEIAAKGVPIGNFNPTSSDWVELYNPTSKKVDLGNWRIGSAKEFAGGSALPAGTIIEAGGYLIVWFNHEGYGTPEPVIDKKLDKDEDDVFLWMPDGKKADEASWTTGQAPEGKTWGRSPDGSANWKTFDTPTPRKPNP